MKAASEPHFGPPGLTGAMRARMRLLETIRTHPYESITPWSYWTPLQFFDSI
jgi:hypothetical protein